MLDKEPEKVEEKPGDVYGNDLQSIEVRAEQ